MPFFCNCRKNCKFVTMKARLFRQHNGTYIICRALCWLICCATRRLSGIAVCDLTNKRQLHVLQHNALFIIIKKCCHTMSLLQDQAKTRQDAHRRNQAIPPSKQTGHKACNKNSATNIAYVYIELPCRIPKNL